MTEILFCMSRMLRTKKAILKAHGIVQADIHRSALG